MGTFGNLGKVNWGNPDGTLALCRVNGLPPTVPLLRLKRMMRRRWLGARHTQYNMIPTLPYFTLTFILHLLSDSRIWLSQAHSFSLTATKIFLTFVCSLINDALFLFLHVYPTLFFLFFSVHFVTFPLNILWDVKFLNCMLGVAVDTLVRLSCTGRVAGCSLLTILCLTKAPHPVSPHFLFDLLFFSWTGFALIILDLCVFLCSLKCFFPDHYLLSWHLISNITFVFFIFIIRPSFRFSLKTAPEWSAWGRGDPKTLGKVPPTAKNWQLWVCRVANPHTVLMNTINPDSGETLVGVSSGAPVGKNGATTKIRVPSSIGLRRIARGHLESIPELWARRND